MEKMHDIWPEGLEVIDSSGDGYEVLVRYQSWRVAVITYAERFDVQKICRLERHLETDEVFVLMAGDATLFIGQEGALVAMERYKAYNIKRGAWHGICVSRDAKVLICENEDTGLENTEYMPWKPLKP